MKTIKEVRQYIATIALSQPALLAGGISLKEASDTVTEFAQGFDEVEIVPLKTNFGENKEMTHITNLYVFKKYTEDAPAKSKKADA